MYENIADTNRLNVCKFIIGIAAKCNCRAFCDLNNINNIILQFLIPSICQFELLIASVTESLEFDTLSPIKQMTNI